MLVLVTQYAFNQLLPLVLAIFDSLHPVSGAISLAITLEARDNPATCANLEVVVDGDAATWALPAGLQHLAARDLECLVVHVPNFALIRLPWLVVCVPRQDTFIP